MLKGKRNLKEGKIPLKFSRKQANLNNMASRRDLIRMDEEELWKFIDEQKSLQVGTLNKDSTIHLSTLWFAINDDKSIVFETYTKSQKILNLQRDPRITLLLEDGTVYEKLRGVMIRGTADLYDQPEDMERLAAMVLERNNPGLDSDAAQAAAKTLAAKRTAVVVKAKKIATWDHTKLSGTY